jgi:hypothetical protein
MESSVHSLSGSSATSVLDSYGEPPIFQGSSELEPKAASLTPAAPIAPRPSPATDQAAQLRVLLASHLTNGGSVPGAGSDNRSLEELLDVLYSMTAPIADVTPEPDQVSLMPAQSGVPVSISTVAEGTASAEVTELAPAIAPPAATVPETVAAIEPSLEPNREPVYTFVGPVVAQSDFHHNGFHQNGFHQEATPHDTQVPVAEEASVSLSSEPVADVIPAAAPMEDSAPIAASNMVPPSALDATIMPMEDSASVSAVGTAESVVEVAHETTPEEPVAEVQSSQPAVPMAQEVTESQPTGVEAANVTHLVATEDSLSTNPASDVVVFSFATAKSTASLQIPVLPNLSLLVLEQRAEEIVIKIHLAL